MEYHKYHDILIEIITLTETNLKLIEFYINNKGDDLISQKLIKENKALLFEIKACLEEEVMKTNDPSQRRTVEKIKKWAKMVNESPITDLVLKIIRLL